MNKLTVKKLMVTGALLLVTALLAALCSGAAYSENRSESGSGCSACALACTACAACSACTCLSCLGGGLDLDGLGYEYEADDYFDDYDNDYEVGDYIDLD